ncbi:MAG TPA: tRNA (N6-threonylcarbamoyladenosine(37)-N6)-methyltransferase TrmO [Chryseosolibacter sp.]|nr:tRNA (N6-threonylcarbamoyladenosine(37)-N6)-methyltransferase TrmO [Chryseosolibacter sp.]
MKSSDEDHRIDYDLAPIGFVESSIKDRMKAPSQGNEGVVEAWIKFDRNFRDGIDGMKEGDSIIVFTWLHQSKRDVLKLHARWDPNNPLTGVFSTRSPDRPNPIGMHPVTVIEIGDGRIKVSPLEAIDGTPVIDIKPLL